MKRAGRRVFTVLTVEPIAMPELSIARVMRLALCAALCTGPLLAAHAVPDQAKSVRTGAAEHRPVRTHKRTAAKPAPAIPAPQVAVAPVVPPPPNWPVNDKPAPATVAWDSHGLRVDASNSSLGQILKDISTYTGAKLEGPTPGDVRVFGTYGPGPANEVLSQLLNGTGYNVLMIGDQGSGAPRRIVLSSAPTGPAPPNSARNSSSDDDYEPEQPTPEQPQPMNGGFMPPQPRTPQQMEDMQLRQEQMQQQIRNQMLQQQQQQMPPDTQPQQQH